MKRILGTVVLCFALSLAAYAEGISLKLCGGISFLKEGDYSSIVQGRNDYYHDVFDGWTLSGEIEKLKLGEEFDAEFILHFSDNIGLGLGLGYVQASNDSTIKVTNGTDTLSDNYTPQIVVAPLGLSLHGFLPLGPVNIHLSAGPAVCFSKVWLDQKFVQQGSSALSQILQFTSQYAAVLGLQGGLGLELRLSDSVFLTLDAAGRWGNMSPIKGTWTLVGASSAGILDSKGTGTLWYGEEVASNGTYYATWKIASSEPSGSSLRNVHNIEVSLNSYSIKLGLRFVL